MLNDRTPENYCPKDCCPEDFYTALGATWLARSPLTARSPIQSISTDSRTLAPGDLFVALRGDRFDGHGFVAAAAQSGAIAAVVDSQFELPSDWTAAGCSLLQVPDTLAAYQALGHHWRQQFAHPVVAVTGSVGKTTTKELVAAMLGTQGPVLKTQANYNNDIGVPKTLLGLTDAHRYAVVEMGMRGLGEIARLAQIAEPDVGLITNVGTAHIERLGSETAIAQAKCELLAGIRPGGTAVLNADNPRLMAEATSVWSGSTLTFGLASGDVRGELLDSETLEVEGQRFRLPLPGRHNAINFCAALAVARVLGVDWDALTALQLTLPGGRSRQIALEPDIVLLDETYNAGFESMGAALELLAQTPGQRRIAVLGTMKELGDHSLSLHRRVGEIVARLSLDQVMILASPPEAEALVMGARGVPSQCFSQAADLVAALQAQLQPGDRLLFKASRSVALDQVVDRLVAQHPPRHFPGSRSDA